MGNETLVTDQQVRSSHALNVVPLAPKVERVHLSLQAGSQPLTHVQPYDFPRKRTSFWETHESIC